MSVETSPHTASHRHTRDRLLAVAAAVAAALLVRAIMRYGAGVSLRTPAFSAGHQPSVLTPGLVAAVSGLVSLAAWAFIEVAERMFRRPRRVWLATGLVALGISLSAPLSGHGVTTAQRIALACMHLAVGAVLITMSPEAPRRSDALATSVAQVGPVGVTLRRLGPGTKMTSPKATGDGALTAVVNPSMIGATQPTTRSGFSESAGACEPTRTTCGSSWQPKSCCPPKPS